MALQPHENSKDGQTLIKSIYVQHGGPLKLKKAYIVQASRLIIRWNSAGGTKTLTNHFLDFLVAKVGIVWCCRHTWQTPPTKREQVLMLLDSIQTATIY